MSSGSGEKNFPETVKYGIINAIGKKWPEGRTDTEDEQ